MKHPKSFDSSYFIITKITLNRYIDGKVSIIYFETRFLVALFFITIKWFYQQCINCISYLNWI